jgi:hypothetical protein
MGDLLIERDRARSCILLPVGAKRRGPQQLQNAPPDSDPEVWWSSLTESAGTPSATQIGFRSCVLLCCLAFRCVLAIARYPILLRAQAREGEAEKLRLSFRYLDGP